MVDDNNARMAKMSNDSGELKKKRTSKSPSLQTVREITDYMRSMGVHQFSYGDLTVVFDPLAQHKSHVSNTIDDEEAKNAQLRSLLEDKLSDAEADLNWSV